MDNDMELELEEEDEDEFDSFTMFRIIKDLPGYYDDDPYAMGHFIVHGYQDGTPPLLIATGRILPADQGFFFLADGESGELYEVARQFTGPDLAVDPEYRAALGQYALILTKLWVDKPYRRKGLATEFLEKLRDIAASICPDWTGIYLLVDPFERASDEDPYDWDYRTVPGGTPDEQVIAGMFRKHGFQQKERFRGNWIPMWLVNRDLDLPDVPDDLV